MVMFCAAIFFDDVSTAHANPEYLLLVHNGIISVDGFDGCPG
jgi:hypothetical protein